MPPLVLTADQKAAAKLRGGADLVFLFGREEVDEDAQCLFYHVGVRSVNKLAAFAKDVDDLLDVMKNEFGLDPAVSLAMRSQVASVVCAYTSAQARFQRIAVLEADAETRNWTKPVPKTDYMAMRVAFELKYGHMDDEQVPAREYIEKKLEDLESGELRAEALTEVVSKNEIEPDVLMPVWDQRTGALSVKKNTATISLPTGPERLRKRLTVWCNAMVMVACRHANRPEIQDITPLLVERYKTYLLGDFVYNLTAKNSDGTPVAAPTWAMLIAYEHAIRKRACQAVNNGETRTLGAALSDAWKDAVTKDRHFTTPLALMRPERQAPGPPKDTPWREDNRGAWKPNLKNEWKKKGKGAGKKGSGEKGGKKGGGKNRTPDGQSICFRFNDKKAAKCNEADCRFLHVCNICFAETHPAFQCPGKANAGLDTRGGAGAA
jgi:hypothetical protein